MHLSPAPALPPSLSPPLGNRISSHISKLVPTAGVLGKLVVVLAALCLSACQSGSFNETAYPYEINTEKLASEPVKKLVISNVNFGTPSKQYLKEHENKVDSRIKNTLESAGYQVEDNEIFKSIWREAIRKYGEPYSPVTSQINTRAFQRVMYHTLSSIKEQSDIQAVVFTDLVERQVSFGGGINRAAKWDGVTRKPKLKGAAGGVSQGFDWSQTVPAISISVTIYHVDGQRLFQSIGGIEVTRQLDPNKGGNGRFIRRKKLLTSQTHIREGVSFALHPFVEMKKYPKK